MSTIIVREYAALRVTLMQAIPANADVATRMQVFVDAAWPLLHPTGVSWIGFYLDQPAEPDDRRMVLGPCRDKPACSPIGLHGACGKALTSGMPLIVRDVRELGANYIACDPRDRSEIVIPLWSPVAGTWGVLDVDSWDLASFGEADRVGLAECLRVADLWVPQQTPAPGKNNAPA